jgi:alanyl-tRNA synthetase
LVGKAALEFVRQEEEVLGDLAGTLRVPSAQVVERVNALLEEIKSLKKQVSQRRPDAGARVSAEELLASAQTVGGATVVIQAVQDVSPDEMRQLIDVMRKKQATGLAVMLISAADGKVQLVAGLSKDLIERGLHAGNWLKEVAPVVGGGGGGRPDLAQAGGKSPDKINAALEHAARSVKLGLENRS